MRLSDFYGRRTKRRTGDNPARRDDLRSPVSDIADDIREQVAESSTLFAPEVEQRAAPATPRHRNVRRPKTRT